jgi:hypothetical protein
MSESREQAQFRRHLAEMRRAAAGLGRDVASEVDGLDDKIERLGHATRKQAKVLGGEISEGLSNLGEKMDDGMRRVPQHIANAGAAVRSGAVRTAEATHEAVVTAGHRAKVGTQIALASAAGVNKKPMHQWAPPTAEERRPPESSS